MQIIVLTIGFCIFFIAVLGYWYLNINWVILSAVKGLFINYHLRMMWLSFILRLFLITLLACLLAFAFERFEISIRLSSLTTHYPLMIDQISASKILLDSFFTPNLNWLLLSIILAQGLTIKRQIDNFSWLNWIIFSILGIVLSNISAIILYNSFNRNIDELKIIFINILPFFTVGLTQIFTFSYLNDNRRSTISQIWIVGWINAGLFLYFLQKYFLDIIKMSFLFSRDLNFLAYYGIPCLLISGWLAFMTEYVMLAQIVPDD